MLLIKTERFIYPFVIGCSEVKVLMKKRNLLQGGEELKKEPGCIVIEHFSERQTLKKNRRSTLDEYGNTPLARWFREGNTIVGVL